MDRLITDIGPIRYLTNLTNLNLHTNWISGIEPLSGLVNLEQLLLSENPISDLSPTGSPPSLPLPRHRPVPQKLYPSGEYSTAPGK